MHKTGASTVTPRLQEGTVEEEPMLGLNSGYVLRSAGQFPKQGVRLPWRLYQNYILDFLQLRLRPLRDKVLEFK